MEVFKANGIHCGCTSKASERYTDSGVGEGLEMPSMGFNVAFHHGSLNSNMIDRQHALISLQMRGFRCSGQQCVQNIIISIFGVIVVEPEINCNVDSSLQSSGP